MRILHALAGFFLFFELPIPIYWLILHPFNSFWRKHVRAAFWIAGLTAWTFGGVLLWVYRGLLLASEQWLDRYGSNEAGALPKAGRELARRFGD